MPPSSQNVDHSALPTKRQEYESLVMSLKSMSVQMRESDEDVEMIARTLHSARRSLAIQYKELTEEPLRSQLYKRSFEMYGDGTGPTIEYLRAKGKSWDQIIDSACRPGRLPEIDAIE
jgi:hypothetical protein